LKDKDHILRERGKKEGRARGKKEGWKEGRKEGREGGRREEGREGKGMTSNRHNALCVSPSMPNLASSIVNLDLY
jgi:flagellar biosynthesis/type III secretory pathway protein FliH